MRRPRRAGEPAPIREVLPSILRGMKGAATGPLDRVRKAWAEVVGPSIAGRTLITAVEGGEIRVEVASAALKHDLATFRREEVLRALRERLPEMALKDVSYRVGASR